MDTEKIRISYKPENIKLLLVGESPPAGGEFFYVKSLMTVYTSRAFEGVFNQSFTNVAAYPIYTLPFPGNGHQNKFIQEFSNILEKHYV